MEKSCEFNGTIYGLDLVSIQQARTEKGLKLREEKTKQNKTPTLHQERDVRYEHATKTDLRTGRCSAALEKSKETGPGADLHWSSEV